MDSSGFYPSNIREEIQEVSRFIEDNQSRDWNQEMSRSLNVKVNRLAESLLVLEKVQIGIHENCVRDVAEVAMNISLLPVAEADPKIKGLVTSLFQRSDGLQATQGIKRNEDSSLCYLRGLIEYQKLDEAFSIIQGIKDITIKVQALMDFPLYEEQEIERVLHFIQEMSGEKCRKILDLINGYTQVQGDSFCSMNQKWLKEQVGIILIKKLLEQEIEDFEEVIQLVKDVKDFDEKKVFLVSLLKKGCLVEVAGITIKMSKTHLLDFYEYMLEVAPQFKGAEGSNFLYIQFMELVKNLREDFVLKDMSLEGIYCIRDLTYETIPKSLFSRHDFLKEALASRKLPKNYTEDILNKCIAGDLKQIIPDLERGYRYKIGEELISKNVILDKLLPGGSYDLSLIEKKKLLQDEITLLKEDPRVGNEELDMLFNKALEELSKRQPLEVSDNIVFAVCLLEIIKKIDEIPEINLEKTCKLVSLLHQACFAVVRSEFTKKGYEFDQKGAVLGEILVDNHLQIKSTLTTSILSTYVAFQKIDKGMDPRLEPFLTDEEKKNRESLLEYSKVIGTLGKVELAFTYQVLNGKLDIAITPLEKNPVYNTWDQDKIQAHLNRLEYTSLYKENKAFLGKTIPADLDASISGNATSIKVKELIEEITGSIDRKFDLIEKQFDREPSDEEINGLLSQIIDLYKACNLRVSRLRENTDDCIPCYLLKADKKTIEEKKKILGQAIEDFPNYHQLIQNHKTLEMHFNHSETMVSLKKSAEVSSTITKAIAQTEKRMRRENLLPPLD